MSSTEVIEEAERQGVTLSYKQVNRVRRTLNPVRAEATMDSWEEGLGQR